MKTVTLSGGSSGPRDGHAIAALPKLLAGGRGRPPLAGDTLVLVGFSGRGDKDLAVWCASPTWSHGGGHRWIAPAIPGRHRRHCRRRRIAGAFARAGGEGRGGPHPYVVAATRRRVVTRVRLAAIDAGADSSRSGSRTPTRGGRDSSSEPRPRLAAGATFDGPLDLVRRIARARPDVALVRWATRTSSSAAVRPSRQALAAAGSRQIVADLRRRGAPFEAAGADEGSPSST